MKIDKDKLIRLMVRRGWTSNKLAIVAGISYPTVSYLRKGKRGANTETIHKIAEALGVEAEELVV